MLRKRMVFVLLPLVLVMALMASLAYASGDSSAAAAGQAAMTSIGQLTPNSNMGGGCTIGDWTPIASLNTARSRTAVVFSTATDKFYTLGGEATGGNRAIPIEEYDDAGNVWVDKSLLNTGVSNSGAAAVGAYIYLPGGYTGAGVDLMQRYDPVGDLVTLMAAMPAVNYAHAVTALGDNVYVLGGSSTGAAGTTNYIYDTVADSWSSGMALPTPVQYPAATTDGTYIYVLGGNTTNISTVQRYDPVANSWDTIPSMTTGRGGPGAFFDSQNIWAIGGGWATYLNSSEYYDGVLWNAGPTLNTGARTIGAAFANNTGIKAGGWNGAYVSAAEMIDIVCEEPPAPSIVLTKTVGLNPATCATTDNLLVPAGGGGTDVTYCFTVANTGNITLTQHDLVDSELGTLFTALAYDLAPGASTFVTESTLLTQTTVNTATWTAYISDTMIITSSTDSATVTVADPTSVSLSSFNGQNAFGDAAVWLGLMAIIILGMSLALRRKATP